MDIAEYSEDYRTSQAVILAKLLHSNSHQWPRLQIVESCPGGDLFTKDKHSPNYSHHVAPLWIISKVMEV